MTNNNHFARNSLIACELSTGETMFTDWRHDQWENILKAHVQWLVAKRKEDWLTRWPDFLFRICTLIDKSVCRLSNMSRQMKNWSVAPVWAQQCPASWTPLSWYRPRPPLQLPHYSLPRLCPLRRKRSQHVCNVLRVELPWYRLRPPLQLPYHTFPGFVPIVSNGHSDITCTRRSGWPIILSPGFVPIVVNTHRVFATGLLV